MYLQRQPQGLNLPPQGLNLPPPRRLAPSHSHVRLACCSLLLLSRRGCQLPCVVLVAQQLHTNLKEHVRGKGGEEWS